MEGRVLEYAAEEETVTISVGGGSDSSRRGIRIYERGGDSGRNGGNVRPSGSGGSGVGFTRCSRGAGTLTALCLGSRLTRQYLRGCNASSL